MVEETKSKRSKRSSKSRSSAKRKSYSIRQASGASELFVKSPFSIPITFTTPSELPETLRLKLVETFGEEVSNEFNSHELEIALAIACYDVLKHRN